MKKEKKMKKMDFKPKIALFILHKLERETFTYKDLKQILQEDKSDQAYMHTLRQLEERGYVKSIPLSSKPKGIKKVFCLDETFFSQKEQIKKKTLLFLEKKEKDIVDMFKRLNVDLGKVKEVLK